MECQQSIATQTAQEVNVDLRSSVLRRVQFTRNEYEPSSDCSSGDETLSRESFTFGPELIAVSKRPTRLLPYATVVRTNLEPSVTHAPEIVSGQLNVIKTYLKARYQLSDLIMAQQNDRITSNLKRWIENGAPDKGDLEEDSYKILKQFYLKRKDLL